MTPTTPMPLHEASYNYQSLKADVHQELLSRLNLERLTRVKREDAEPEVRRVIGSIVEGFTRTTPLSLMERESLATDVLDELFGLGPLEALLKDPSVSDILVNRFDQVFVEREGKLEETDITFKDERHLMQIIERIVSMVGRRIDESTPMVDARLKDGSRVNAVIPPLALDGAARLDSPLPHRSAGGPGPGRAGFLDPAHARFPEGGGRLPAERHRVGRHRRRQDHAPQRALELHQPQRACGHHRGRRGVEAAPAARGAARNAPGQHRGQGRGAAAAS